MKIKMENRIRILAGTLVLFSLLMSQVFSLWWLLLALFVGINLLQSGFTGFCPAEYILARLDTRMAKGEGGLAEENGRSGKT